MALLSESPTVLPIHRKILAFSFIGWIFDFYDLLLLSFLVSSTTLVKDLGLSREQVSLLLGTVGLFDLRVLGLAKGIPPEAIHRLIPWGVAGYIGNILLGIVFFSGHPEQYFYNDAFRLKLIFMAVAGINILLFYGTGAFQEIKTLPADANVPLRVKIIAGTSLFAWVAVLVCGRMITFNRPPFFH